MLGVSPVRLEVQVQPTVVIPPAVWDGFARAVQEAAHNWGLHVAIGQDAHGSLEAAKQRFWEAQHIANTNDVGRAQDSTG